MDFDDAILCVFLTNKDQHLTTWLLSVIGSSSLSVSSIVLTIGKKPIIPKIEIVRFGLILNLKITFSVKNNCGFVTEIAQIARMCLF